MSAVLPLKARVLAAVAATPSLTRRQGGRRAARLLAVSIATGIGIFQLAGGLARASDRPAVITLHLADGWAMACTTLTWLLFRRTRALASASRWLAAALLVAPLALSVWMSLFHGAYVEPAAAQPWACLTLSLALAATPLACFLRHQQGLEPHRPDLLGAAAGATCGAWAGVFTLLWCPLTAPAHALIGHVVPMSLLTAAGSFLGVAVLRIGGRPRAPRLPARRPE